MIREYEEKDLSELLEKTAFPIKQKQTLNVFLRMHLSKSSSRVCIGILGVHL